uniref:Protein kinase domain-containing protein n=1 Tax=Aegilops tauschii subsp. strangulata TaxID=200361 RepID=A0A453FAF3_AEGTS
HSAHINTPRAPSLHPPIAYKVSSEPIQPERRRPTMDVAVAKQLRRIRTLGRGASGAVVWLASDEASGELLAVKSAGAGGAAQLEREG